MSAPATPADVAALPHDHPGFHDPVYRRRRAEIVATSQSYVRGAPLPEVAYTPEEDAVWQLVSLELRAVHDALACDEYRRVRDDLDLPTERVPQLREVDALVRERSGFGLEPVGGLLTALDFFGALARRVFPTTQYLRHASVPLYTPEPDLVHELIGHAVSLGSPAFASLYEAAGRAAARVTTDEGLDALGRVFWFTMEFGVVDERDGARAYGAGLLSSYGELRAFRRAELRPWDLHAMAALEYDYTTYQPVLFVARSFADMVDDLLDLFERFGDDVAAELRAR